MGTVMATAGHEEWVGREIRELPEVREILQYMKSTEIKKRIFGGLDRDEVSEYLSSVSHMYETAMRKLQRKSEKALEELKAENCRQKEQIAGLEKQYLAEQHKLATIQVEREKECAEYLQMAQAMEEIAQSRQGILGQARKEAEQILRESYDKAVAERQRASTEAEEMIESANRQVYEKQMQADELEQRCILLKKEYDIRLAHTREAVDKLKEHMDSLLAQVEDSQREQAKDPVEEMLAQARRESAPELEVLEPEQPPQEDPAPNRRLVSLNGRFA